MFEYAAFNPFNASPEGLAAELTRKSAEGWEVVSITTTADGRFCAFLRRPVAQRTTATAAAPSALTPTANESGYGAAAASATSAPSAANPSVPAAWYKDPSGRFELRYWNGAAWTEHVARGGQQFTDPPVA
jgi:plasmid replication initiation protein